MTIIYKMNSNKIVRIVHKFNLSDIQDDEDFCPLSYFQQTEDGRKKLEEYYSNKEKEEEQTIFKSEHQVSLLLKIQDWCSNEGYYRYISKIVFEPFNGEYIKATVFHKEVTSIN